LEKLSQHSEYINWRLKLLECSDISDSQGPLSNLQHIKMTKWPSVRSVSFSDLENKYGALDLVNKLIKFVVKHNNPDLGPARLKYMENNTLVPHSPVSVFHKVLFWNHSQFLGEDDKETHDAIHVRPDRYNKQGQIIPGRFDTVLIKQGDTQVNPNNHSIHSKFNYYY
jgi:hypothetical protein